MKTARKTQLIFGKATKNLLFAAAVALAIFSNTQTAGAQVVQFDTTMEHPIFGATDVQVAVADGAEASASVLEQLPGSPGPNDAHVVVTDNDPVANLGSDSEGPINSVLMATAISGVKTFSIVFISHMPSNPKIVSSVLATFFAFYMNLDADRWPNFVKRWQGKASNLVTRIGFPKIGQHPIFVNAMRSLTSFVGTASFTAMFMGIAMWDQYLIEMATHPGVVLWNMFLNAGRVFLMSQPIDTLLTKWSDNGHPEFTPKEVKRIRQAKSLIFAMLSAAIFSHQELAPAVSTTVFLGGLGLLIADSYRDPIKVKMKLSWDKIKKSFDWLPWRKNTKDPCDDLLTKPSAE